MHHAKGTQYYTDEDGTYIKQPMRLEQGLIEFYERTGVKPYVYLLSDNTPITSHDELEKKGDALYDELFDDEAHLLLLGYRQDGTRAWRSFQGRETWTVMDSEAVDILLAYLDTNLKPSNTLEGALSSTFTQTAERIMSDVPESTEADAPVSLVVVIAVIMMGIGGVLIVVAAIRLIAIRRRVKRAAERAEAERMERILSTPIEQLDDTVLQGRPKSR